VCTVTVGVPSEVIVVNSLVCVQPVVGGPRTMKPALDACCRNPVKPNTCRVGDTLGFARSQSGR